MSRKNIRVVENKTGRLFVKSLVENR